MLVRLLLGGTGGLADVRVLVLLVIDVHLMKVLDTGIEQLVLGGYYSVDFALRSLTLLGFVRLQGVGYEH